ncbi:hypothetical protein [Halopiger aswanensis]|uniref:Uncharacterized protein n=1 Tax=Halopiger aswanensis TaxID=148449 RepID=A0A3R7EBU0_9EURY|nr:hypothetical protein ATJ93_4479 [Halopiger aswanensis]
MFGAVILIGGMLVASGTSSATPPPRPGTDESGLSANETATLWAKEPDDCISDEEYYDRYGENRTKMQAVANCTDITFADPPTTAKRWTTYDFESLEAGDTNTSVYPPNAETRDSTLIADAHATIFAVQPSTMVHLNANETPLYVAPEGEIRGFIDYRVRVPDESENETSDWSLVGHEIEEVRLIQDGEVIAEQTGQQTPVLEYDLEGTGPSTLTLEADIQVELEETITTGTETRTEVHIDNLTVSSSREVNVYDLTASIHYANYPNGDTGIAIYQAQPWHGYQLTEDGDAAVRGVWRYYTARNTDWDRLVESSATEREVVESDAHPVYVRAYPSEIGPRADPIRDGPVIEKMWGTESSSPMPTVPDNVAIDIVEEPYTRSYGLAIRYDDVDRNHLQVQGIVRGETAELVEPQRGSEREIRESELSVELLEENESAATFEIELRDAETGDPIVLEPSFENHPRVAPIGVQTRAGYITIADQRVETDTSGTTTVTVTQPGIHTVEYHPGSWRTHNPAYVGDTVSVSWNPLTTASGWITLFIDVLRLSIPFLIALYAGLKLGSFLHVSDEYHP